jgi:hypothetical protein
VDYQSIILGSAFLLAFVVLLLSLMYVVMSSVFLWAASKKLKFKKQDFRTAFRTVVAYTIVSLILSLALILSFLGIGLPALLLAVPVSLLSMFVHLYIIRRFYDVGWKNTLLTFLLVHAGIIVVGYVVYLIVLAVVAVLGVFLAPIGVLFTIPVLGGDYATNITGFYKMQPFPPSIAYGSDGNFTIKLVGVVETPANLTYLSEGL